jgi:hypothetical protein
VDCAAGTVHHTQHALYSYTTHTTLIQEDSFFSEEEQGSLSTILFRELEITDEQKVGTLILLYSYCTYCTPTVLIL